MLFPTIEFVTFMLLSFGIWLSTSNNLKYRTNALVLFNVFFYGYHSISMLGYLVGWTLLLYSVSLNFKLKHLIIGFSVLQLIFWKAIEAGYIEYNNIITPLGLSFFTFQGLTYIFAKMGLPKNRPNEYIIEDWSLLKLFAFTGFFPTVLSGPILRAKSWSNQLENPIELTNKTFTYALTLIALGSFYKLAMSTFYNYYVTIAYASPKDETSVNLLFGMYAYAFEIYHDFAGYSLMAMGIALMYGFKLPQNFNQPYFSVNIKEFWQRWHITFSSWLRDYFYFSIGGSRGGYNKHFKNTLIVMLVCGAWHGLSGNYLVWGLCHALAIIVYHSMKEDLILPKWLGWLITFNFISLSWIFFRSPDLQTALSYIGKMLSFNKNELAISGENMLLLVLFSVSLLFHKFEKVILKENRNYDNIVFNSGLLSTLFWVVIFLAILIVSPSGTPPFIYFSY